MKNVIIFTLDDDLTSNLVCEILKSSFKVNAIRVNYKSDLEFISYDMSENELQFIVRGDLYSVNDIYSVWYRRNVNGFSISESERSAIERARSQLNETMQFGDHLLKNAISNRRDLFVLFLRYLSAHSKSLGNPFVMSLNKLWTLRIAESIGLTTPKSWVVTQKKILLEIREQSNSLITKAIEEGLYYFSEDFSYSILTNKVDEQFIASLPEIFPPSLFQEEIDKEFEIRSFYLDGEFYSMAIFSQEDGQTKVDFRNYNQVHPNKTCPYNLPKLIQRKLRALFLEIKLNCGSVDLIKSRDGRFVFLEINPVGQFGMVSRPCNYNLEYLVAQWLTT